MRTNISRIISLTLLTILTTCQSISTNCTVDKCIVCQDSRNLTCTNCANGFYLKTLSGGDRKYDACWSTTKLVLSMIGGLLLSILSCALCFLCYKLGENAYNSPKQPEQPVDRREKFKDPYYRDPYRDLSPIGSPRRRSPSVSPPRRRETLDRSPRPITLSNQNNPSRVVRYEDGRDINTRPTITRPPIEGERVSRRIVRRPEPVYNISNDPNVFRGSNINNDRGEFYESKIPRDDIETGRSRPESLEHNRRVDRRYSPERGRGQTRQVRSYRENNIVRDSDINVVENMEKFPRN